MGVPDGFDHGDSDRRVSDVGRTMMILTEKEIAHRIDEWALTCQFCGAEIESATLRRYPHPHGTVTGKGTFWFYIHCACDYDWSLTKLVALARGKGFLGFE